jgi:hypothetical protein
MKFAARTSRQIYSGRIVGKPYLGIASHLPVTRARYLVWPTGTPIAISNGGNEVIRENLLKLDQPVFYRFPSGTIIRALYNVD